MWKFLKQIVINVILDLVILLGILSFQIKSDYTSPSPLPTNTNHITITSTKPITKTETHQNKLSSPANNAKATNQLKQGHKSRHTNKKAVNNKQLPPANKHEKKSLLRAQRFWIKQLGVDPFWNIPIYWHSRLASDEKQMQPLGVTHTLVGSFPLSNNHQIAYMQIDDKAAKKQHIDLAQVLAHEWGHALGLKHGYGIMEPVASNMTWRINKVQRKQIISNYHAGH